MPLTLQAVLLGVFPALVIVAALKDITSYLIPNWISLTLTAVFAAAALATATPWPAIGVHLAIGLAALAIGMGFFALNWIGGGDAKLMAVSALWLGWPALQVFVIAATLSGGLLALTLLFVRSSMVRAHTPALTGWADKLTTPGEPAPYGVALAVGALIAFPGCDLMRAFHGS